MLHLHGVDDPRLASRLLVWDDGLLRRSRCARLFVVVGGELVADRLDGERRPGRTVHALRRHVRGDAVEMPFDLRSLWVLPALRPLRVRASVDDHELRVPNVARLRRALRSLVCPPVLVVRELHVGVLALYELSVARTAPRIWPPRPADPGRPRSTRRYA